LWDLVPEFRLKFLRGAPLQCSTESSLERDMTHKIDAGLAAVRPLETANTGATARAGTERSPTVAATSATDTLRLTGDAEGLQALERELVTSPAGIDLAKVQAVRAAIADGSYRIDAAQIASRMIDLDRQLGG
jgi:negative regulator of flagellin synthesis FlgM